MPILVTGATGFLGGHLLDVLRREGRTPVRALARSERGGEALAGTAAVVRGDVLDPESLRAAAGGCELIFHLAGLVSHRLKDRARLEAANVEGVRNLLAAAEPGARIVHVSSVAAVGPARGADEPADERHEFPPSAERYVYASTKRAGEQLALEAAAAGRDVVVANPGFLLGPGDVHRVSTWHVGRYLAGTLRFTAPGGLSNVDARDVAAGLVALADRGRRGERYILTSREGNVSHREFFRRLADATGVRRRMLPLPKAAAVLASRAVRWPVAPDEVQAAANWWFFDPGKAERELGFTTRGLEETLLDTTAQYRA